MGKLWPVRGILQHPEQMRHSSASLLISPLMYNGGEKDAWERFASKQVFMV